MLVNSLQPLMTLYPVLGEWRMAKLPFQTFSKKGRELLRRHMVLESSAGKFAEIEVRDGISRYTPAGFSERNNQQMAFVGMYYYAREVLKMSDMQAADYARVHGQVRTQFLFTRANQPYVLSGPIRQTLLQYKRFLISNVGHFLSMLNEKGPRGHRRIAEGKGPSAFYNPRKYLGAGRMFLMYGVWGGAAGFMRLAFKAAGKDDALVKAYKQLKDSHGKQAADLVFYGVPGYFGTDISGSLSVVEIPEGDNLAEIVGNLIGGPTGAGITDVVGAGLLEKKVLDEHRVQTMGRAFLQSSPALNPLSALANALSEDTSAYDLKGRLRHRQNVQELWMKAFSLRPTELSFVSEEIDYFLWMQHEHSHTLDVASRKTLSKKWNEAVKVVREWNRLYPHMPITRDDLLRRVKERALSRRTPMIDRQLRQLPKAVQNQATAEGFPLNLDETPAPDEVLEAER
jgi:hypothetical protein